MPNDKRYTDEVLNAAIRRVLTVHLEASISWSFVRRREGDLRFERTPARRALAGGASVLQKVLLPSALSTAITTVPSKTLAVPFTVIGILTLSPGCGSSIVIAACVAVAAGVVVTVAS